jgi:hypothetical protein
LGEDEHIELHDVCCAWIWVREKMVAMFTDKVMEKYDGMFLDGSLGKSFWLMKWKCDWSAIFFVYKGDTMMCLQKVLSKQGKKSCSSQKTRRNLGKNWILVIRPDPLIFYQKRITPNLPK